MTTETAERSGRPPTTVGRLLEPLLVLLAFAAAGALAGWWWERWWTPITGVVVDGTWIAGYRPQGEQFVFDFPSLEGFFDGTAQYVVLGLGGGLLLGILCGLLGRRSELVMLVAVVLGSALAGFVAYRLGTSLAPVDPVTLESSLPDGTVLPAGLSVPGTSPFVAWPLGALLGLGGTYLLTVTTTTRPGGTETDHADAAPEAVPEGSAVGTAGRAPSA
jgi:hypothetical protein